MRAILVLVVLLALCNGGLSAGLFKKKQKTSSQPSTPLSPTLVSYPQAPGASGPSVDLDSHRAPSSAVSMPRATSPDHKPLAQHTEPSKTSGIIVLGVELDRERRLGWVNGVKMCLRALIRGTTEGLDGSAYTPVAWQNIYLYTAWTAEELAAESVTAMHSSRYEAPSTWADTNLFHKQKLGKPGKEKAGLHHLIESLTAQGDVLMCTFGHGDPALSGAAQFLPFDVTAPDVRPVNVVAEDILEHKRGDHRLVVLWGSCFGGMQWRDAAEAPYEWEGDFGAIPVVTHPGRSDTLLANKILVATYARDTPASSHTLEYGAKWLLPRLLCQHVDGALRVSQLRDEFVAWSQTQDRGTPPPKQMQLTRHTNAEWGTWQRVGNIYGVDQRQRVADVVLPLGPDGTCGSPRTALSFYFSERSAIGYADLDTEEPSDDDEYAQKEKRRTKKRTATKRHEKKAREQKVADPKKSKDLQSYCGTCQGESCCVIEGVPPTVMCGQDTRDCREVDGKFFPATAK